MNILDQIFQFIARKDIQFILCAIASFFIGRYIPSLLIIGIKRFSPRQVMDTYEKFINSYRQRFQWAATLILILVFSGIIYTEKYREIYAFFNPVIQFLLR
ncbi:MAG: mechanosensitive ion channel family protein, partial [Cyanobacteria bacterium P01_D01_bin.50]